MTLPEFVVYGVFVVVGVGFVAGITVCFRTAIVQLLHSFDRNAMLTAKRLVDLELQAIAIAYQLEKEIARINKAYAPDLEFFERSGRMKEAFSELKSERDDAVRRLQIEAQRQIEVISTEADALGSPDFLEGLLSRLGTSGQLIVGGLDS